MDAELFISSFSFGIAPKETKTRACPDVSGATRMHLPAQAQN